MQVRPQKPVAKMGSDLENKFGRFKQQGGHKVCPFSIMFFNLTLPHGGSRGFFLDKQATPGIKRSAARFRSCISCFRGSYLTKIAKACVGGATNRETHVGGWGGQKQEGNSWIQTECNMGQTTGSVKANMKALEKQKLID